MAGFSAFIWRLILTTGTGSIFGFLVARQAYDTAIMAPMFIIMSFSFGLAIFILVLMGIYKWSDRPLGDSILFRLKNLLGVFIAAVLYFVLAYHLTNLYITENHGVERFILMDGGVYTQVFWILQIGLGSLLPLALLYQPVNREVPGLDWHCLTAGDHRRSGTDLCHHHRWPGLSAGDSFPARKSVSSFC